jgi:hypothetical protein
MPNHLRRSLNSARESRFRSDVTAVHSSVTSIRPPLFFDPATLEHDVAAIVARRLQKQSPVMEAT